MAAFLKQKILHVLFEVGITLKAFNGLWETVSGLAFLLVSKATLSHWLFGFAQNELIEDPRDRVMNFVVHILLNPETSTKTFAALYVLFHGLLNIFLAVQLYREKHWAYLVTIWSVLLFMVYQVYRIATHHSLILTVITVFDVFYVALVWHEYKRTAGQEHIDAPPMENGASALK